LQKKKIQGLKPKNRELTGMKMMIKPKNNINFLPPHLDEKQDPGCILYDVEQVPHFVFN
jgi:hypothetical protein